MTQQLPILYSFRRCPYAIRARLAIKAAGLNCELREVVLRDKPNEMLVISEKGTVPVLQLSGFDSSSNPNTKTNVTSSVDSSPDINKVIDESIDVMAWALKQSDPFDWLNEDLSDVESKNLIAWNDGDFKNQLDRYKYFDRHPEFTQNHYLEQALPFLETLESRLSQSTYISGSKRGFTDAAIMPFIRQFYMSDQDKFHSLPLPKLQQWLDNELSSELFLSIMKKYPQWHLGDKPTFFGNA